MEIETEDIKYDNFTNPNQGPKTVWIAFNKVSGRKVMELSAVGMDDETFQARLNHQYYDYKEVTLDPELQTYVGDFDTGEVVNRVDQGEDLSEYYVDALCHAKIHRIYKEYHQLNVMRDLLSYMMTSMGIQDDESIPEVLAFNEMDEYIKKILVNNENLKQAYSSTDAYNYLTKEEIDNYSSEMLDGGLIDVIRRPDVTIRTPWTE